MNAKSLSDSSNCARDPFIKVMRLNKQLIFNLFSLGICRRFRIFGHLSCRSRFSKDANFSAEVHD